MSVLAIRGGTPLRTDPFPGWTVITPADKEGLKTVFHQSDWGCDGPQNRHFQERFAKYCGVKHCITVANGTVSLELILRAGSTQVFGQFVQGNIQTAVPLLCLIGTKAIEGGIPSYANHKSTQRNRFVGRNGIPDCEIGVIKTFFRILRVTQKIQGVLV